MGMALFGAGVLWTADVETALAMRSPASPAPSPAAAPAGTAAAAAVAAASWRRRRSSVRMTPAAPGAPAPAPPRGLPAASLQHGDRVAGGWPGSWPGATGWGSTQVVAENIDDQPLPAGLEELARRGARVPHGVRLSLSRPTSPPGTGGAPAGLAEAGGGGSERGLRAGGGLEAGSCCRCRGPARPSACWPPTSRLAQAELGVPLALEHVAALLEWPAPELDEAAFLTELLERTGALLLLDLANLYANARNHGGDPLAFLDACRWSGSPRCTWPAGSSATACTTTPTPTHPAGRPRPGRRAEHLGATAGGMWNVRRRPPARAGAGCGAGPPSPRPPASLADPTRPRPAPGRPAGERGSGAAGRRAGGPGQGAGRRRPSPRRVRPGPGPGHRGRARSQAGPRGRQGLAGAGRRAGRRLHRAVPGRRGPAAAPGQGGALADGLAFAGALARTRRLSGNARVEAMLAAARLSTRPARLAATVAGPPRRLVVTVRAPGLGEHWLSVPLG